MIAHVGNQMIWAIKWSHDRLRHGHVTPKGQLVTPIHFRAHSAVPTVEATEAVASAKIDAAQLKDLL